MEVAGLVVGVAGLSGLFTACIDCFELVQRGRYLGKDFYLLETRFSNQRLRLEAWGRACGLAGADAYDTRLDEDEDIRNSLESTLIHLLTLLRDGNKLRSRYGLCEASSVNKKSLPWYTSAPWPDPRQLGISVGRKFQELGDRIRSTQKGTRPANVVRWVVEDRQKFTELVENLKNLIDDLEGLTRFDGVQERQREFIRREVETINDVHTLEAIEEARAGERDSISDAASLRLWNVRDKFGQSEVNIATEGESTGTIPASSPVVAPDDRWEFLPSDSTPPTGPLNGATYQCFYRVFCSSSPTAIFLDEPTYNPSGKDNQWVVLDKNYPTHDSRCLHLCGKRTVPDLEDYLLQCRTMEWISIQNYYCQHDLKTDRTRPSPSGQSVRLISQTLCSLLRDLAEHSGLGDDMPGFQPCSEHVSPYLWYYQYENVLRGSLDDGKSKELSPVVRLFDFISDTMAEEYSVVKEQLSRGVIALKYIHYLFVSLPLSIYPSRFTKEFTADPTSTSISGQ